jgi:hypothetical protein
VSGEGGQAEATRTRRRVLRVVAVVGFVLAFVLAAVLLTLRLTVLDAAWYQDAIDDSHAYSRVYDRVLTDPEIARETRRLLAGLPIDESLIDDNARIVLPPATVRHVVNGIFEGLVGYMRGSRSQFDPFVALQPLFDNIRELANQYLSDFITNLHPLAANDLNEFGANIVQFANDLGAGRKPTALPTVPFTAEQANSVADILLRPIDENRREALRLPLVNSLVAGDLNTALGTVAPEYGRDNTDHVIVNLRQDANGTHVEIDETLTGAPDATVVINLRRIRFLTATVLPLTIVGLVLLAIGCLVAIGLLARRDGRRASISVAVVVAATGLAVVALYTIVRLVMSDPFTAAFGKSKLPAELHGLLFDIADRLFDRFDVTLVRVLLLPVAVAALVLVWVVLVPWLRERARATSPQRVGVVAGALTVVVALVFAWLLVPRTADAGPRRCNGHAELCDHRYDKTVFAESHNAMSVSDLKWFGSHQDVDMTAQLDYGVRVLHIDTRYWETPETTAKFASSLPPNQQGIVLAAVAGANPVRPGVWLCHSLCRLGALELDRALRQIRGWIRSHPDDVVTLDIENRTSDEDTIAAFKRAKLVRYAFTPPDPGDPWPTLGEMLDSGKRLVVFVERQGGEPGWFAKLYRYAMETPYTFRKASAFTCKANRGGRNKQLFVMNHFITRAAPSRSDAAAVNQVDAIVKRARRCKDVRGQIPNFVQVNFSTLGDVPRAIDVLNGLE